MKATPAAEVPEKFLNGCGAPSFEAPGLWDRLTGLRLHLGFIQVGAFRSIHVGSSCDIKSGHQHPRCEV